jgi:hypothetical protein
MTDTRSLIESITAGLAFRLAALALVFQFYLLRLYLRLRLRFGRHPLHERARLQQMSSRFERKRLLEISLFLTLFLVGWSFSNLTALTSREARQIIFAFDGGIFNFDACLNLICVLSFVLFSCDKIAEFWQREFDELRELLHRKMAAHRQCNLQLKRHDRGTAEIRVKIGHRHRTLSRTLLVKLH